MLLLVVLCLHLVQGQIPGACVANGKAIGTACCPIPPNVPGAAPCGSPSRGSCSAISSIIPGLVINSSSTADVRDNWPYYFNMLCKCNGNFYGYDCGECKFGYGGDNCTEKKPLRTRKSVSSLSPTERDKYVEAIKLSKSNPNYTRYMAIRNERPPQFVQIPLYDLFVWMHDFAGRENDILRDCAQANDYAHESAGFLTWHRIFLLWFERELQIMTNDPNFSLLYWDWTNTSDREVLFTSDWLGNSTNGAVQGDFGSWQTICWNKNATYTCDTIDSLACDPTVKTGTLRRCPVQSLCSASSSSWPTKDHIKAAVSQAIYDSGNFFRDSQGLRGYVEGFINNSCDSSTNPLCTSDGVQRLLHNAIHIKLGMGGFNQNIDSSQLGVMSSVPASANDPIFLNHHTMIDYIFEQWLQNHSNATYTGPNTTLIPKLKGHGPSDVLVPFIPLYTNNMAFMTASEFGYEYEVISGSSNNSAPISGFPIGGIIGIVFGGIGGIIVVGILVIVIYRVKICWRREKKTDKDMQYDHYQALQTDDP